MLREHAAEATASMSLCVCVRQRFLRLRLIKRRMRYRTCADKSLRIPDATIHEHKTHNQDTPHTHAGRPTQPCSAPASSGSRDSSISPSPSLLPLASALPLPLHPPLSCKTRQRHAFLFLHHGTSREATERRGRAGGRVVGA